MCGSDIFLGLLAILFPPLAVWVKRGICSADSLINIALCCLGLLPGVLHAWYIIATTPEPTFVQLPDDAERGDQHHVTYYYVEDQTRYAPQSGPQGKPQRGGYGTVNSSAPNSQFPAPREGFVQPPAAAQAGPSDETPPTYQQAVGDNKVQHP